MLSVNGGGPSFERTGLWLKNPIYREFTGNFANFDLKLTKFSIPAPDNRRFIKGLCPISLLILEQGNVVNRSGKNLLLTGYLRAVSGNF